VMSQAANAGKQVPTTRWIRLPVALIATLLLVRQCGMTRIPDRWLVPEGHQGWLKIDYVVKSAPELPIQNGYRILRFPATGYLQTSSAQFEGWSSDRFIFEGTKHRTLLTMDYLGGGGNLWYGGGEPEFFRSTARYLSQRYFIGTEKQFRNSGGCRSQKWPVVEASQRVPWSE
jgi:hypothetical protein